MTRYPESKKAEARRLVKEGATQRTVAQKIKVPEPTLSRWIRQKPRKAAAKGTTDRASPARAPEAMSMETLRRVLSLNLFDSDKVRILKALIQ